jgi:hypothetical protein
VLFAPLPDVSAPHAMVLTVSPEDRSFGMGIVSASSVLWRGYLSAASARYPLTQCLQGRFVLGSDGWLLDVTPLSPFWRGKGRTPPEAEECLKMKVHSAFQELYAKRLSQMTEMELKRWSVLRDVIDVDAYWRETPITTRELGIVKGESGHVGRHAVEWVDGRTEVISFELAPPEFAGLRKYQWFEAIAWRDTQSGKLRELRSVRRTAAPRRLSSSEAQDYWDSLPSTNRKSEP